MHPQVCRRLNFLELKPNLLFAVGADNHVDFRSVLLTNFNVTSTEFVTNYNPFHLTPFQKHITEAIGLERVRPRDLTRSIQLVYHHLKTLGQVLIIPISKLHFQRIISLFI